MKCRAPGVGPLAVRCRENICKSAVGSGLGIAISLAIEQGRLVEIFSEVKF